MNFKSRVDFNLELEFVAFEFKRDFYGEIYFF